MSDTNDTQLLFKAVEVYAVRVAQVSFSHIAILILRGDGANRDM